MKTYLVTVFDKRSTHENPVEPRQVVVNSSEFDSFLIKTLDAYHYCLVSSVETPSSDD